LMTHRPETNCSVIAETVLRWRPEHRERPARDMGWCCRIRFSTIRRLISRAVSLLATRKLFKSIFRTRSLTEKDCVKGLEFEIRTLRLCRVMVRKHEMKNRRAAGAKPLNQWGNGQVGPRKVRGGRQWPYQNPALSVEKRLQDLLGRMTLEEKAAQMMCVWQKKAETLLDAEGNFDLPKARASFLKRHGIGQVGRPSDAGKGKDAYENAELTNAIQKFFIENTRLGIPVLFHEECLHGQASVGATSFPQPIGLAATFNPDLVKALYAMTAEEARSRGTHQALTPVVDVARDPRWGRVEETFGEDPFLVSRMGIAAVLGFQGDGTFRDRKNVLATLKHFVAHGQPESGINCAPAEVSARVLREIFLYPFKEVLQKGGRGEPDALL
jgi:hypothetical protein